MLAVSTRLPTYLGHPDPCSCVSNLWEESSLDKTLFLTCLGNCGKLFFFGDPETLLGNLSFRMPFLSLVEQNGASDGQVFTKEVISTQIDHVVFSFCSVISRDTCNYGRKSCIYLICFKFLGPRVWLIELKLSSLRSRARS